MTIYNAVRTHTMVPESAFWENLFIAKMVEEVGGCIVECGVWKGGMSACLWFMLKRRCYLLDSFEGLPFAQEIDGPKAITWQRDVTSPTYYNNCKADEADVVEIMRDVGCLDYEIVKGWLADTLLTFEPGPIALLRIDVDWYEATRLCLEHLRSKVVVGGIIIFDDYDAWEGCRRAVHEFISSGDLRREGNTVYWIKQ